MSIDQYHKIKKSTQEDGIIYDIVHPESIPFEVKRVYYLFGTKPGVERGFHAHKKLQQFAVCVSGSCRFRLDDGFNKKEVLLDARDEGLVIGEMLWHEMYDFSHDCVLVVLASDQYDESDYIRNYDEFLSLSKKCM